MCVYYPHEIMHLSSLMLNLLDLVPNTLIIKLNPSKWIMPVKFTSKAFDDYCMALGIKVEHSIPYVHTQNGLPESLIN